MNGWRRLFTHSQPAVTSSEYSPGTRPEPKPVEDAAAAQDLICELEYRIRVLEAAAAALARPAPPAVVIERMFVERLTIDKVDLSNNFGQLGIRELTGKLNIGTVYEKKGNGAADKADMHEQQAESNGGSDDSPKVNIRRRT